MISEVKVSLKTILLFSYSQSSNLLNQARLKVLKARDEHVGNVLADTKRELGKITRDQQKYSQLLQGLIAQVNPISKVSWLFCRNVLHKTSRNLHFLGSVPTTWTQDLDSMSPSRSRHCSRRHWICSGFGEKRHQNGNGSYCGYGNLPPSRLVSFQNTIQI